jgi:hypothetical protein
MGSRTLNSSESFNNNKNTQNYWVPGLCPSSGILNTRNHNKTTSITGLRLALSKGPNRAGVSLPSP